MPCGLPITLLHTLEYGHLDRTSDHPRAEHTSASRPAQQPIRPSRARAPAELRSAASNIVQSWQPASRRQTRRARCPPTPLPFHEPLHLGPKAPHNLYTEWDECRPLRKISMSAHRVIPPSPLLPLATVAGELARGVRTDCTAIIIMEFPCNASVDDVHVLVPGYHGSIHTRVHLYCFFEMNGAFYSFIPRGEY